MSAAVLSTWIACVAESAWFVAYVVHIFRPRPTDQTEPNLLRFNRGF